MTWDTIESPFSRISPLPWWADMIMTILVIVVTSFWIAAVIVR